MANESNPNDPSRANDPYRANDPSRSKPKDDSVGRETRFDDDLPADPELAEGQASAAKIAFFRVRHRRASRSGLLRVE